MSRTRASRQITPDPRVVTLRQRTCSDSERRVEQVLRIIGRHIMESKKTGDALGEEKEK